MNEATKQRIDELVTNNPVMVFMKGDRYFPQCGFSGTVIQILENLGAQYTTADILSDPELRQGIKEYSNWPTIPQVYVQGKFVGGCDIMRELYTRGELPTVLEPALKA
ncbi:Grx4 family monothiol glutaredoxin [Anthocerotibacter panamensis]|uniref:Grx4 family monothiol glutaredoxin n=1 Tax=Anthocerotibacter panamensis TaxID=2857077 RepID=UPI001C408627|nr:Grx4 family monothiol glutaredoxin [Anthocerotibacter panamensis]